MACQWLPWVVVSTPTSRVTTRRPAYKKFSLMTPRHDPTVDWFTLVDVPQKMLAIMFHKQWEQELMTFTGTEPRNEVVVPGPDVQHTHILFKELHLTRAKSLVTQLGRRPRVAIMPAPWYKGSAMQGKSYQLFAFVRREKKIDHAPFLFSYVLAAFWDIGEVLGFSSEIALQTTTYNQVRVGVTKDAMEYFRPHMMRLNDSVGLVLVDEGSGEWLTDSDVDATSTGSTIPDPWGQVTSVYAINVPPWYDQKAVHTMLGATGDEKFVVDRVRWRVGELRTCTWKVRGPGVQDLVGHLLRSTEGDSPVHIISSQEYTTRRGKSASKGGVKRDARPAPAVEMMDLDTVKFMKRTREGDVKASS